MSPETSQEPSQRPRFRLFTPETSTNSTETSGERLSEVSHTSESSADPEDDPCIKKEKKVEKQTFKATVGPDPRFQQQNQTMRCFVMYTDFFRCEKILGEGHDACTYFKEVYETICPNDWINRWDEFRSKDIMPWSKAYYEAVAQAKRETKE